MVYCNLGFDELALEPEPDQREAPARSWRAHEALGWRDEHALGASTLSPTPIWCVNLASAHAWELKKTSHMCACFFSLAPKPNRSPILSRFNEILRSVSDVQKCGLHLHEDL